MQSYTSMTKAQLLTEAQSIGLRVSKNAPKWQIIATIQNHYKFIQLNQQMANRYK